MLISLTYIQMCLNSTASFTQNKQLEECFDFHQVNYCVYIKKKKTTSKLLSAGNQQTSKALPIVPIQIAIMTIGHIVETVIWVLYHSSSRQIGKHRARNLCFNYNTSTNSTTSYTSKNFLLCFSHLNIITVHYSNYTMFQH